jgi:hypothetical protein
MAAGRSKLHSMLALIKKRPGQVPRPRPLLSDKAQLAIRIQSLIRAATALPASHSNVASPRKGNSKM